MTPSGDIAEFPIPSVASDGGSTDPASITASSDGTLWFTESKQYEHKIGRITAAGSIVEVDSDGTALGIAFGSDHDIWFTAGSVTTGGGEPDPNLIERIDPRSIGSSPTATPGT